MEAEIIKFIGAGGDLVSVAVWWCLYRHDKRLTRIESGGGFL